MSKILFIQTGGTIDKNYPPGPDNHGYAFQITEPAYEEILKRKKVDPNRYRSLRLMQEDSLDMDHDDRETIVSCVKKAEEDRIVITHGTDRIQETAEMIKRSITGKTVVLTGAMLPEVFRDSDAEFNVGGAFALAQVMQPGVYIFLGTDVIVV